MDLATAKTLAGLIVYLIALLGFFFKLKAAVDLQGSHIAELKSALFDKGSSTFVAKTHCTDCSKNMVTTLCTKLDALKASNEKTLERILTLIDGHSAEAVNMRERMAVLESLRK